MPLPRPSTGETKNKFLQRCMGDETAVKDFPQAAQRFAVCSAQNDKRGKSIPLDDIQSVIFAKTWFQTKEDAQMYLQGQGYLDTFLTETDQNYIYEQQPETVFIPKSLETMEFPDGVSVVCGAREPTVKKSFDPKKLFSEATLQDYDEVLHHSSRSENLQRKDMEEYFGCKYAQLVKLVDGFPPYRANLFRFALNGVSTELGCKAITNYDEYDSEFRSPVEYISFSTGTETHEGVFRASLFLEVGGEKLVASVDVGWGGCISLRYFSIQKDTIAKFQNQITSYIAENNFLKGKKLFSNGSFIKLPKVGWDDIILPDEVRNTIQKNVIDYITHIPELQEKGLPVKRGLLLHGNPGCGKTFLGKVIANEVDCTFIWVPYSVDGNNMSYKDVFEMARELAPTIVLMEDLASQGGMDRRRTYDGQVSGNLGLLLNILEGVEENAGVVTIATENYVENLDVALRNRPGRFDIILHMPNPAYEQRSAILAKLLPEFPAGRVQSLAVESSGMSCAHLRELAVRLTLEDGPVDRDQHIIQDMIKTFGILIEAEDVIETDFTNDESPHANETHIMNIVS